MPNPAPTSWPRLNAVQHKAVTVEVEAMLTEKKRAAGEAGPIVNRLVRIAEFFAGSPATEGNILPPEIGTKAHALQEALAQLCNEDKKLLSQVHSPSRFETFWSVLQRLAIPPAGRGRRKRNPAWDQFENRVVYELRESGLAHKGPRAARILKVLKEYAGGQAIAHATEDAAGAAVKRAAVRLKQEKLD